LRFLIPFPPKKHADFDARLPTKGWQAAFNPKRHVLSSVFHIEIIPSARLARGFADDAPIAMEPSNYAGHHKALKIQGKRLVFDDADSKNRLWLAASVLDIFWTL
jgi:hypothetical protein